MGTYEYNAVEWKIMSGKWIITNDLLESNGKMIESVEKRELKLTETLLTFDSFSIRQQCHLRPHRLTTSLLPISLRLRHLLVYLLFI